MVIQCLVDRKYVGIKKGELYRVSKEKKDTYSIFNDRGSIINVKKEDFKKKNWLFNLLVS